MDVNWRLRGEYSLRGESIIWKFHFDIWWLSRLYDICFIPFDNRSQIFVINSTQASRTWLACGSSAAACSVIIQSALALPSVIPVDIRDFEAWCENSEGTFLNKFSDVWDIFSLILDKLEPPSVWPVLVLAFDELYENSEGSAITKLSIVSALPDDCVVVFCKLELLPAFSVAIVLIDRGYANCEARGCWGESWATWWSLSVWLDSALKLRSVICVDARAFEGWYENSEGTFLIEYFIVWNTCSLILAKLRLPSVLRILTLAFNGLCENSDGSV